MCSHDNIPVYLWVTPKAHTIFNSNLMKRHILDADMCRVLKIRISYVSAYVNNIGEKQTQLYI